MESRAGFLLLKEEQKLEREMNGYMNWICKAGETIIFIKKRNFHENRKIRARRRNFTIFSSESNEKAVISASIFGVIIRHTCTRTYIYLHFNVPLDVPFPNFPIYLLHLN